MLENSLAIVLAGGHGRRLAPLTEERAKAAVPFGGKYRIIDFPLTNCLRSGIRRILVLTQYKSHSLQKHLRDGWSIFNPELGEYVTPVPPQMRSGEGWYNGTADAAYQNLYLVKRSEAKHVLVLPGDHVYRMDYAAMFDFHARYSADLTVTCMQVPIEQAKRFGIVTVNQAHQVSRFIEGPEQPAPLPDVPDTALASMDVLLFSTELFLEALERDHANASSTHDFAADVLPALIGNQRVFAYQFGGAEGRVTADRYWRDVATVDDYYEANMDLLQPVPPLDLYQPDWSIRTYQGQNPPARTVPGGSGNEGIFINSIVGGGVVIAGGSVQQSILSPGVYVGDEAVVEDSILFEGVVVGDGARIRSAIIDKHVTIPPGERVGYDIRRDVERFTVTDKGVVVVPRGYRFS